MSIKEDKREEVGEIVLSESILISEHKYPVRKILTAAAVQNAAQVAGLLGMGKADAYKLELAVEEAFINAVEHYSQLPKDDDFIYLTFKIDTGKLVISLREKGIPFSLEKAKRFSPDTPEGMEQPGLGTFLIQSAMDHVELFIHGREGKELRMEKNLCAEKISPQLLELCSRPVEKLQRKSAVNPYIRLAIPDDVPQICRLAWRCYNYTQQSMLYDEKTLKKKIASGEIVSFIIKSETSEDIIYHAALKYDEPESKVPEVGLAFADPAWRCSGATEMMIKAVHKYSQNKGDDGIYDRCVTTHIFSQKGTQKYGSHPCNLLFCLAPAGISANVPGLSRQEKGSIISSYCVFNYSSRKIYFPQKHLTIVQKVYGWLGLPREFCEGSAEITGDESQVIYEPMAAEFNCAYINVMKIGKNTIKEIVKFKKQALFDKLDATYVCLPAGKNESAKLMEQCEEAGYSFAGVMPHIHSGDDRILMQQINIIFDRELIKIFGEEGNELMDYVYAEYKKQM